MEVILLERVQRLGNIGDVVKVKDGYARNFLIPMKKALRATDSNKALFDAQKAEIQKRNDTLRKEAEAHSQKVEGLHVTIIRQASEDGRLFGSVSARDIAKAAEEKQVEISHQGVRLDTAIKTVGIYPIRVVLHPEVVATVKVVVARSDNEAQEAIKSGKIGGTDAKSAAEALLEEEATQTEAPAAPEGDSEEAA